DGLRMSIYDADPEGIQEKVRAAVEKKRLPLERSTVAPVFGVAMLKAGKGEARRALWLRANRRVQLAEGGWHGHNDSMNIGLFGYGLNLLPDGEKFDLKRWVFGHNTVSRQETPLPHFGKRLPPHAPDDSVPKPILSEIDFLAEFPGIQAVRAVGIKSKGSRRTVFLVDVGSERFYVLDSLRVAPDIPEGYVTYCFSTMQGKITRGIGSKVSKDKLQGRSRTGGYWLEPLIEAPLEMGKKPWSIEVAIDDTYKVLENPSDVKVRFTCLRPVDRIWHAWYKAVEGLPMKPKRVPYWFMTLGKPSGAGMPRQFTAVIEPYRKARPVRAAKVLPTSGADVIEVDQANDRLVTFLSSDGRKEVSLPRGASARAEVAVVIRAKGAREIGLCLRGRYVRTRQGLALEAVDDEPAVGGFIAGGEGKFEFIIATPIRVTLPGTLAVKVKHGASLKDLKIVGARTSFTLVPDDALRGRGEFTVAKGQ
ncbi:MAG: hypothetical protein QGD94_11240, partial [Planctomycetia bacterium]|nr:hypothetical protein [Planctomycetia bacterium]